MRILLISDVQAYHILRIMLLAFMHAHCALHMLRILLITFAGIC